MTLNLPAPGNWCGVMDLQAQPAPRKLERGEDNQIGRSKDEIPQYADLRPSVPRKRLQELAEKLSLAEEAPTIGIEAMKIAF